MSGSSVAASEIFGAFIRPVTALVDANASEVTPAARPAASSALVPTTLVAKVSSGCSIERSTEVTAARWTIESKPPSKARSSTSGSAMSPITTSTDGSTCGCRSTTRTRAPAAVSSETTWRPMKPEPPVTRTRRSVRSEVLIIAWARVAERVVTGAAAASFGRPVAEHTAPSPASLPRSSDAESSSGTVAETVRSWTYRWRWVIGTVAMLVLGAIMVHWAQVRPGL